MCGYSWTHGLNFLFNIQWTMCGYSWTILVMIWSSCWTSNEPCAVIAGPYWSRWFYRLMALTHSSTLYPLTTYASGTQEWPGESPVHRSNYSKARWMKASWVTPVKNISIDLMPVTHSSTLCPRMRQGLRNGLANPRVQISNYSKARWMMAGWWLLHLSKIQYIHRLNASHTFLNIVSTYMP
jgi:hypothetical protein